MHKSRTSSMILAAFLTFGIGFTAFSYTPGEDNKVEIKKSHVNLAPQEINNEIFSNSTELDKSQMTCYLTAATRTEKSITITANFSIGVTTTWGDRNGTTFMIIDDPDYSGDKTNPSLSGIESPVLSGYVTRLDGTSSKFKGTYVIPEKMTYGSYLSIQSNKISANAIDFSELTNVSAVNIVIPSTVTVIEANAFKNVPSSVTFSCVAESKPTGWADNWTDAPSTSITFGYNDSTVLTPRNLVVATSFANITDTPIDDSYMIGYINKPGTDGYKEGFVEADLPLVVCYDIINSNTHAVIESVQTELPLLEIDARNSPFDAVGNAGDLSISVPIDVFLSSDQTVDFESVKFYNIYKAKKDATLSSYCCDTSTTYSKGAFKRFSSLIRLGDVIDCSFKSIATFAGYTLVKINVDKTMPLYYKTVAQSIIEDNKDKIDSGDYRIRYTIANLSSSAYRVTYNDGEQKITKYDIKTPLPVIEIAKDSGNEISFMIKNSDAGAGFNANNLQQLEIFDFIINMHLWDNNNNSIVGRTSRTVKFGIVDIMPYSEQGAADKLDLNLTLLIIYLIYIGVYAVGAVAAFFYLKEKYKNDEFRRIKPKKYVKSAVIGFFGLAEVLLFVIGLIYRTALFRNSLSAFNPSDVIVVLAGLIAFIIIGYFIKTVVGIVKTNKARREIVRLKLNEIKE